MLAGEMDPHELAGRLSGLTTLDRVRLGRRLEGARRLRDLKKRDRVLAEIAGQLEAAELRMAVRRGRVPQISYPAELPVAQRRDDLLAAVRDHQVVVVAGETGSGKTTQLPKIALELGRGVAGLIGHTQPRRIAARAVADRIAEELGTEVGDLVGYQVRFTDQVTDSTMVKLMTDGILLAEIGRDRLLHRYDTLIIDEAHERSLNIDFLLGYLRTLLPRRPDLKVVVTSATIDPQRFADHFATPQRPVPVVEVSGRTYPVELRYRPLVGQDGAEDRDQVTGIADAVRELAGEGPGDVLVFLSGEREIRDTAETLQGMARSGELRGTEVLPLYARLSSAEQHRVFSAHPGRRVVLATNVAETSLTVPGIRYVVDPGTARISRYSNRTKVQRLPIEAVSQASARQRAGRCGRLEAGICIRLYEEEDFERRPAFTDPEIQRTNLASVILAMAALDLGDIADFPFLDPPDRRQVSDGVQLLEELGALDRPEQGGRHRLTQLGRRLAQLPVDPRLARMILEADRHGVVREVMVIAAALTVQDPRERPTDAQEQAAQAHARFRDPTSDFLGFLNLWQYLREQQRELSGSAFRRMCRAEYLNYLRIREWQDLVAQLRSLAAQVGVTVGPPRDEAADPDLVHRSLLAGLLSHVGVKEGDRNEFLGARGAKFAVFPGSALFKKPPACVMSAELVETSRLWARVNARIDPLWAEELAPHLVKRSYSEPHWEANRGAVMAFEKVTLYGVPLVPARKVGYAKVDPALCRELFIRHALVEGDWRTQHAFFRANRELLEDVEELEHRYRRRDILVDDETLFAFYDARLPADVVSGRHFDAWWKKVRRDDPELLTFTPELLIGDAADEVHRRDYPDSWRQSELELPLTYQFEPGAAADGVTVHVPVAVLNRVTPAGFDWQIPGLRDELATALLRALPKAVRRQLVPAPDHARAALARLEPSASSSADGGGLPPVRFCDWLGDQLHALTGVDVPPDQWDPAGVPAYLRITFRVEAADGTVVAEGKDLPGLQARLRPRTRSVVAQAAAAVERTGLKDWTVGELPRTVERPAAGAGGMTVRGYPALVDEGATVAVRVLLGEAEQQVAMRAGLRRLLRLNLNPPAAAVLAALDTPAKLVLAAAPHRGATELLEDCTAAAIDRLVQENGGVVRDRDGWDRLLPAVRSGLTPAVTEVVARVVDVLTQAQAVERRLGASGSLALLPALADLRGQLDGLVHPGFATRTGWQRLPDLVRYLRAAGRRLDVLGQRIDRDLRMMEQVRAMQAEYDGLLARVPAGRPVPDDVAEIRWMIEEFRVSLFAQGIGTAYPVSEKRILAAVDAAADRLRTGALVPG
jgi:ATP-dependent helicase HrpA